MNKLQAVLATISDSDLRLAVGEVYALDQCGVLPDGVVRRTAAEVHTQAGVSSGDALTLVQTHVVRVAAFRWAGLGQAGER